MHGVTVFGEVNEEILILPLYLPSESRNVHGLLSVIIIDAIGHMKTTAIHIRIPERLSPITANGFTKEAEKEILERAKEAPVRIDDLDGFFKRL